MEKFLVNNNVSVILFNRPSINIILDYINKDKDKFKSIVNNKLTLLTNKYKFYLSLSSNPLSPKVPGDIDKLTYIKKYIAFLNIIINNNYEIPENEMNLIVNILNESINIFLDKLKINTLKFIENLTFYKNQYKNECWLNHFIQLLSCQPVFTKHFEKYVKNAYINYLNLSKENINLNKMNITLPEYNYIFNNIPLYNYDVLQNILDTDFHSFIEINKYNILPENVEINIIDPYYLLPNYNNRKYYKFDHSGFCINDDNFLRIYNISDILLDGKFYFIRKTKANAKYIILVDDIKKNKLLADIINIYACFIHNDYFYLIENNESLSFNSMIINTQKDTNNIDNKLNVNNINSLYFDDNTFNGKKYAYCKVKEYVNNNSVYTPFNGLNISHLFLPISSIINKYFKKNNDILYIVSYYIIKIFRESIYNRKINTLREPLFYVFDLLNVYSNFNIPLCKSPDPLNNQSNSNKLNKSTSLNNLNENIKKINSHNKSQSYNNVNSINNNINTIHNFLLDSKFYNLFNT